MEIIPFQDWDLMSIVYSLVASVIFLLVLRWAGLYKKVSVLIKNKKALKMYKKQVAEECNTLIVVGKRRGFSLNDVYVELDLTPSDLMNTKKEDGYSRLSSFTLLGGPGAGKSTTAKNFIIEHLKLNNSQCIPFFVRLKDYNGNKSIFNHLVERLENFNFTDPVEVVKKNLIYPHALCVLDGLDEVRPHLREKICNEINDFYSTYFKVSGKLVVTCRKEAYRDIPLNLSSIMEVRPLSDEQIIKFAAKWPLDYPAGKSKETFFNDLKTSSRIMELVRSPLMLVGGLMHYTEANLGIPEERFEYLQTMAKWLVVDWAMAQGHPSEQYRNVYDRILTSLAFYMHQKESSEILYDDAVKYISSLLPTYGYLEEEAEQILRSITIKTGILMKDGSSLFFAQFGLQEFYASKELSNQCSNIQISKLQPSSWWREVILLHSAQQKDPTELLINLFGSDPLLAVAAVAECPTPSLKMQEKAVDICLKNIDIKNDTIKGSLIPFLRKIKDGIEVKFFSELEKRLTGDREISSIVGISLATAGTPMSTNMLAKHPEVWDICLSDASYLSSSFESLLLEWIQNENDFNSIKAADLLAKRITSDRLFQLLKIIPLLKAKRKEHISKLLLEKIALEETLGHSSEYENLNIISQLVPNISNAKHFLRKLKSQNANEFHDFRSMTPTILTSFFIKTKDGVSNSEYILKTFSNGIVWDADKDSIFLWIFSACFSLLFFIDNQILHLSIFISVNFYCILSSIFSNKTFIRRSSLLIYTRRRYFFRIPFLSRIESLFSFTIGGIFSIYFLSLFELMTIPNIQTVCLSLQICVLSVWGFARWSSGYKAFGSEKKIKNLLPLGLKSPFYINIIYLVSILILCYCLTISNCFKLIIVLISCGYITWLLIISFILFKSWKTIKKAEREVSY